MVVKALQILSIYDSPKALSGLQAALENAGMAVQVIPVHTLGDYVCRTKTAPPEAVLLFYHEAGFANLELIRLHQELIPQVPLLVLAESLEAEKAVELMREGARDIVLHNQLSALPAALSRALKKAENIPQPEQSLQLSYQHLSKLLRMTPVGVFRCDTHKNCFYVNDRYCELTGLTPEQAYGDGWIKALHPEDKEIVLQGWYLKKGVEEQVKSIYRYLKPQTGEVTWVIGQSISEHDEAGNITGYLGSVTDITRLKLVEKDLKEKNDFLSKINQELDSFVYSASHNLRAPLTSLMGLINLIRLEANHPNEQKRICSMMEESIKRLDGFIRDILDHSRNARIAVQPQPVDAESLVREVLAEFSLHADFNRILVAVKVQQNHDFYTDASRLRTVLRNLVSNCIRYQNHYAQPEITITIRVEEQEAVLQVCDNGIGIRPEHQSRVFDMFYRADEYRSGSGLGLYITREVVNKLEGSIELTSEPAKGTVVKVVLPNQKEKHDHASDTDW